MKSRNPVVLHVFFTLLPCLFFASTVSAQGPAHIDPENYKTVFENDQVRVLRINYDAVAKSVMYNHPKAMAINVPDRKLFFAVQGAQAVALSGGNNQKQWDPDGDHVPPAESDDAVEVIVLDMKAEEGIGRVRKAISSQSGKLTAAFNRRDTAAIAAIYAENAHCMPPNRAPLKGREAIRTYYDTGLKTGMNDLTMDTMSLESSGKNTAFEVGTFTTRLPVPEGGSMQNSGKYMAIWKKQADGTWLIQYNIWNSNLPAVSEK